LFKIIKSSFILSLITLMYSLIAFATSSTASILPVASLSVRFQHLTIEDGLPQNSINTILQDSMGFLWLGTEEGLVRYDGYSLKIFKHESNNTNSLSNDFVLAITEDRQGTLWVGTGGGLNRFNPTTEKFSHYRHIANDSNSLSDDSVRTITEDRQGILWLGTGGGLNRFNPATEKFSHYRHIVNDPNSLSDDSVRSITEDRQGTLWVGTDSGLHRFNPTTDQFSHYRHIANDPNSLSDDSVRAITEDRQGTLWVGTNGGGLNRFNPTTEQFSHYRHIDNDPTSLSNDSVRAITEDQHGTLWVGIRDGGLNRFNPTTEQFSHYRHIANDPKSLSDDTVVAITEDRQGILWVGTNGGGLNRFNPTTEQFSHYRHIGNDPNSLSHDSVRAMTEDRQGMLWVGTGGGLNRFNPTTEQFSHYRHIDNDPNSLSNDVVYAVTEDRQGILWVGTNGGGLSRFDPITEQFRHYRHIANDSNSLSNNTVRVITEDRQGILWVGTGGGGLNRFNPTTELFSHYRHIANDSNSLSHDTVVAITEDRKGILWVGTRGGGLNRYNPTTEQFSHYRHIASDTNSLSHDTVMAISEDRQGALWVGTYGGGLNRFNSKTEQFTRYSTKNGLPNNVIYRIEEDNQGNIWLSTNQGLSRMEPISEIFKNYDVGDGLQSNEFNALASFKNNKGELFFGGISGFNRFHPENITDDTLPPIVVITEMLLLNQSVLIMPKGSQEAANSEHDKNNQNNSFSLPMAIHQTKAITLSYKDNIIAFEFAALHFSNPKKNQFAYQLVGWDKDWVATDYKNRRATYTNLPDGDYTFRVKASNGHNYWNEQGASLKISVLPPPWKTWWAYTLYSFFLLSLIFAFIRHQRKKVFFERDLNAKLEGKVIERTAELESQKNEVELKNSEVEAQRQTLEEKNKEILATQKQLIQSSKMASIGTMTAGVAHEINNPTNFAHAAVYMMNDEISEIKSFLKQLAGGDEAAPEVLQSFDDKFTKLIELTKTASEGTTRIKTIVEDLRTFARLDDAKQEIVQLSDLLKSTIHLVQTQYDSIVIKIQLDYEPLFTCFPSKINQVFMNIIVNACQAIESKKLVEKTLEGKVTIKTTQNNNQLVITFEDNGGGMNEDTVQRIFDPFFTTKNVGSGTGLGMAISFGIIEEHSGRIEVESSVNEGTRIIISFDM
jgi:ligand-binding sensor domain-containing protein/signal transduction histidine kinase